MVDFARYLNIRSAVMPVLSADGRHVAFLTDISGNFQVWSVSTADRQTAWPRQLTFFADKVWDLYGTAAASQLIAVGDVGGNECQQLYLISGYGPEDSDQGHTVSRLTSDDQAIHRFGAWSADGQQIVYTSNARNAVDFDYYQLDLQSGDIRLLGQSSGNRSIVAWSPDQHFLLVAEGVGALQNELYLFDLRDGVERHLKLAASPARYGQIKWTTSGLYLISDCQYDQGAIYRLDIDPEGLNLIIAADSQQTAGELALLAIASDERIAYTYNANGYSRLYVLDSDNASRRLSGPPPGLINRLSFSNDGTKLLLDLQSPNRNPDIWLVTVADGSGRQLTHSDRAGIPQSSFVIPEEIHYRTFDDLEIPALYYRPQQAPPDRGYACILYVHGGPTSQIFPDFDVRFQYFLSQGYAVLAPNVRGSSGYGREYAALDEIEKRMESVADLQAAVLWLQRRSEIDADRVAIYGRSYGGYMVLAALTEYPELFAAGIDVVGIANWVTFMERTSTWRRSHREQEYGSLEDHRDVLTRISPIHKIEEIKVPLMVVAGDNDPRVPLFESEQVVQRVEAAGSPVYFIHYPDEGHKISKLANRIDSFTRMADFLRKYLSS